MDAQERERLHQTFDRLRELQAHLPPDMEVLRRRAFAGNRRAMNLYANYIRQALSEESEAESDAPSERE